MLNNANWVIMFAIWHITALLRCSNTLKHTKECHSISPLLLLDSNEYCTDADSYLLARGMLPLLAFSNLIHLVVCHTCLNWFVLRFTFIFFIIYRILVILIIPLASLRLHLGQPLCQAELYHVGPILQGGGSNPVLEYLFSRAHFTCTFPLWLFIE